ncbi:hypothetical protein DXG01_006451 [Tephrocybe rancida]|nr:hypothetical protein DXG01_006451 [Tephrocybe rancida]
MIDFISRATSLLNGKDSLSSGPDYLPVVFAIVTLTLQLLHRNLPALNGPQPTTAKPSLPLLSPTTPTPTSALPPTPTMATFDNSAPCNFVPAMVMIVLLFIGLIFAAGDAYIRCKTGNIFMPRSPTRKREPDPPRPPPPSPIWEEDEHSAGDEGNEEEEEEEESDDGNHNEGAEEPSGGEPDDELEEETHNEDEDDLQDDGSLGGNPDGEPDDPSGDSNIDDDNLPLPTESLDPSTWEIAAIIIFYASSVTSIYRSAFGKRLRHLANQGPGAAIEYALEWIDRTVLWMNDNLLWIDSMDSGMRGLGHGRAAAIDILPCALDNLSELKVGSRSAGVKSVISRASSFVSELYSSGVLRAAVGYGALALVIRGIIVGQIQRIAARAQYQLEEEPSDADEHPDSVTLDVLEMYEEEENEFVDAPSHLSGTTIAEDNSNTLKDAAVIGIKNVLVALVEEAQQTPQPAIIIEPSTSTSTSGTSDVVTPSSYSVSLNTPVRHHDIFACGGTPSFNGIKASTPVRRPDPFACSSTPSFSDAETSSPYLPRTPTRGMDQFACSSTPSFAGVETSGPCVPLTPISTLDKLSFACKGTPSFKDVVTSSVPRTARKKRVEFDEMVEVSLVDRSSLLPLDSVLPSPKFCVPLKGRLEEEQEKEQEQEEQDVSVREPEQGQEYDGEEVIGECSSAVQVDNVMGECDMDVEDKDHGSISLCPEMWDIEQPELKEDEEPTKEPLDAATITVNDADVQEPAPELLDISTRSDDGSNATENTFEDEGSTILDPVIIKRGVEEMMKQLREDIATKEAGREAARAEEIRHCEHQERKLAEVVVVKRSNYVGTLERLKQAD